MGESTHLHDVARLVGERYGPVARNEVVAAAPEHAEDLAAYAEMLPVLDDATFVAVAAEAITDSAGAISGALPRAEVQHANARHAMARAEALRRHAEAGHSAQCPGVRLYALAYARAVREAHLDPDVPEAPACTCPAAGVASPLAS